MDRRDVLAKIIGDGFFQMVYSDIASMEREMEEKENVVKLIAANRSLEAENKRLRRELRKIKRRQI